MQREYLKKKNISEARRKSFGEKWESKGKSRSPLLLSNNQADHIIYHQTGTPESEPGHVIIIPGRQ